MASKLLFIDTEFTDLRAPILISVALVDDGREFYAERSDFPEKACVDFVRREVLPFLGKESARSRFIDIQKSLCSWLSHYRDASIVIAFDDGRDWTLFCELLDDEVPANISCLSIAGKLEEVRLNQFFTQPGIKRHHALHDARANKFAVDRQLLRLD